MCESDVVVAAAGTDGQGREISGTRYADVGIGYSGQTLGIGNVGTSLQQIGWQASWYGWQQSFQSGTVLFAWGQAESSRRFADQNRNGVLKLITGRIEVDQLRLCGTQLCFCLCHVGA